MANRSVVRDAIDIIMLDQTVLSFSSMICAGCGKDPGFTPELMLEMIQRHATFTPDLLAAENLAKPMDAIELKKNLLQLISNARSEIAQIDPEYLGCIFTDKNGNIIKKFPKRFNADIQKHFGTLKGSWPKVVE